MGAFVMLLTPLSIVSSYHGDSELNHNFLSAAQRGDEQRVSELLDVGAKIETKGSGGYNALMLGAKNGHEDVVRYLLSQKANVHQKANYGDTALLLAAGNGHTPILRSLADAGACLNEVDKNDKTAQQLAEENGHREAAQFLQSRSGKPADIFCDHETATGECAQRLHHDVFGRPYREGSYPGYYWKERHMLSRPYEPNPGPRRCFNSFSLKLPTSRALMLSRKTLTRFLRR